MLKYVVGFLMVMQFGLFAQAGECKIKIAREACPGKEEAAYKPYEGKKETEEKKDVADEKACKAFADKSAKIVRKGTLSAKKVTANFGGKDIGISEDKKDCK